MSDRKAAGGASGGYDTVDTGSGDPDREGPSGVAVFEVKPTRFRLCEGVASSGGVLREGVAESSGASILKSFLVCFVMI